MVERPQRVALIAALHAWLGPGGILTDPADTALLRGLAPALSRPNAGGAASGYTRRCRHRPG
jgi:hypothetical protein